jgi:hypothetical protein
VSDGNRGFAGSAAPLFEWADPARCADLNRRDVDRVLFARLGAAFANAQDKRGSVECGAFREALARSLLCTAVERFTRIDMT